jgi:hypothetical protein
MTCTAANPGLDHLASNLLDRFTTRSQVCQTADSVPFQTNSPLDRFKIASSYVVLRLDPAAHEWLESARRADDAPDPVRGLLTGRSRVEVGLAEAERALAWAAQLPGWRQDGRPALVLYTPGEMLVSG